MIPMVLMPVVILAASLLAQVPNPGPPIAAAQAARTATEAAQQKNADALDADQKPQQKPEQKPGAPQGLPGAPAAADKAAPVDPAGYSYDPDGRRDPFVSLASRGGELPIPGGMRPAGVPGLLISELTLKGVLKSSKGGFIALAQATDNRTYIIKVGDKVFDGSVKVISQDGVVFSQDVSDPLSLVKQREVRKAIRPEAR